MAVRSTMAALILRVRLLINDPAGASQIFADQDIQDIMDETRQDVFNLALKPEPTFSGNTILYLDYLSDMGGWEDGFVLKQYLTVTVTPSLSEPIAAHFQFAATTLPPVYITGKLYDVYRTAADLLERWAAKYMTRFDFASDGQRFNVAQVPKQLQELAHTYRLKQRAGVIKAQRGDLVPVGKRVGLSLDPIPIDYFGSG